jgi:hypothetical protein
VLPERIAHAAHNTALDDQEHWELAHEGQKVGRLAARAAQIGHEAREGQLGCGAAQRVL